MIMSADYNSKFTAVTGSGGWKFLEWDEKRKQTNIKNINSIYKNHNLFNVWNNR